MNRIHLKWLFWLLPGLPLLAYADSDDTFRQLQQGVAVQKQRQEQHMVGDGAVLFGSGAPERGDHLVLALLRAINAQNGVEIRRLLALYEQQAEQDADMVLFAKANLAVADNNLDEAIALYRQLSQRNPQFLRGKLDLARLLFVDKQNTESLALFADMRIVGQPVINQKIDQFVAALDNRDAWHGSVALGPVYARNLNQSSESTVLRPQLNCNVDANGVPVVDANGQLVCKTIQLPATAPEAVHGGGLAYELALNKKTSLGGHHGIQFNANGFGRWYRNRMPYNEHNAAVNLGYVYQDRRNILGVGAVYQAAVAGRQLQNSSEGIHVNISRELSDRAFAGIQFEHKYNRYRAAAYRRFNGPQTSVLTNAVYVLPNNWTLFGGYDYLRKDSAEKVDSYHRHGLRAGINKKFNWGVDATLQASWRKTRYHDYHAWLQTRREDWTQTYQLDVKMDRLAWGKLTPALNLKHMRNRSSSWVNQYKSNEIMLKLGYAF